MIINVNLKSKRLEISPKKFVKLLELTYAYSAAFVAI